MIKRKNRVLRSCITMNILVAVIAMAFGAFAAKISVTKPAVYPYYIDVKQYPDYTKRPWPVPSWGTMHDRPQFVACRSSNGGCTNNGAFGTVNWPNLSFARLSPNLLQAACNTLKSKGHYLWDIGGYIPAPEMNGTDGTGGVPYANYLTMQSILDTLFLGMDIGEQDARYWFGYPSKYDLSINDPVDEFMKLFQLYQRVAEDQADKCSLLGMNWGFNVPIKDGLTVTQAQESQNKGSALNAQVAYAFLRGAGRSYGTLSAGDVSLFATDCWNQETSINLRRRLLQSQYLWNSCILSFEDVGGSLASQVQNDMNSVMDAYSRPGAMHAPVGLMLDFFNQGWMFGQGYFSQFTKWASGIPYDEGDFFIHLVFDMLYPRYEDNGALKNESATITRAPYGDMTDVVYSDVYQCVLNQFGAVVAAGTFDYCAGPEIHDKIMNYVGNGGHFVVTGAPAAKLFPEWSISATSLVEFPDNSTVAWTNSGETATVEPQAFQLCRVSLSNLPAGTKTMATCQGQPAVIQIPVGSGYITLLACPYGHNKNKKANVAIRPSPYTCSAAASLPLDQAYLLANHVKAVLDEVFKSQRLFSVGDTSLDYTVCSRGNGQYMMGIFNPDTVQHDFAITSYIGAIGSTTNIANGSAGTSMTTISAGDSRLFFIQVNEDSNARRVLPQMSSMARPLNKILSMPAMADLQDRILRYPTFGENFEGAMIDWEEMARMDSSYLALADGRWLNRQKMRIIVDFRSGFDDGTLTLDSSGGALYSGTVTLINSIMNKMGLLTAARYIVVTIGKNDGIAGLDTVCQLAQAKGIKVHLYVSAPSTSGVLNRPFGDDNSRQVAFEARIKDIPQEEPSPWGILRTKYNVDHTTASAVNTPVSVATATGLNKSLAIPRAIDKSLNPAGGSNYLEKIDENEYVGRSDIVSQKTAPELPKFPPSGKALYGNRAIIAITDGDLVSATIPDAPGSVVERTNNNYDNKSPQYGTVVAGNAGNDRASSALPPPPSATTQPPAAASDRGNFRLNIPRDMLLGAQLFVNKYTMRSVSRTSAETYDSRLNNIGAGVYMQLGRQGWGLRPSISYLSGGQNEEHPNLAINQRTEYFTAGLLATYSYFPTDNAGFWLGAGETNLFNTFYRGEERVFGVTTVSTQRDRLRYFGEFAGGLIYKSDSPFFVGFEAAYCPLLNPPPDNSVLKNYGADFWNAGLSAGYIIEWKRGK